MYKLVCVAYIFIIVCIAFNKFNKYKLSFMFTGVFIAVILSSITIAYVPAVSDDLYRHYETLEGLRNESSRVAVIKKADLDFLWLLYLYFRFFSILPFNQLLPLVTVLVEVLCIFYMHKKLADSVLLPEKYLLSGMFLFLATWDYFYAASGIRYWLAMSIFLLIVYYDLVKNSNTLICYACYILLCFFHPAMSLLIIVRSTLLVGDKNILYKIICIIALLHSYLLQIVDSLLANLSGAFFQYLRNKLGSIFWRNEIMPFLMRSFVKIPLAVMFLLLVLLFEKLYSKKYIKLQRHIKFCIILFCFGIGALSYDFEVFARLSFTAYMTGIPYYCIMVKELKSMPKYKTRSCIIRGIVWIFNLIAIANFSYFILIQYPHFSLY